MPARLALSCVILLGVAFGSVGAGGGANKPPAKQGREEIDRLIDQLKSDKFKVREEATRRLMECDDALPALEQAAKSDNAEVAGRARKALEAIKKRLAKRALRRATAMLKKGQTDQFVEQVVRWRGYMDEDCWKAAVEHVEAIADKASKVSGGQYKLTRKLPKGLFTLPWLDITKLTFKYGDHYTVPEGHFITYERVVAKSVCVPKGLLRQSFLISRGQVETKYTQGWSVIFANGDVKAGDKESHAFIGDCIVICDGDVTVTSGVANSIILAAGSVRVGAGIDNSVIISGGDVKMALEFRSASAKRSVIQERQRDPLNFIHFFDLLGQVGIEVKSTNEGVRVEAIAAAKPFGREGVRKGDLIVAVDGVKVDSEAAFRHLLRWRIRESKPILLEVRRQDKALHIEVRIAGDAP